jgi:hypothetical protein
MKALALFMRIVGGFNVSSEIKSIPVRGLVGPYDCLTVDNQHFLDSRLADGCEVVSPTRRSVFTSQEDCCSFLLESE